MSLFEELKRRNVFRVSAAYLALGWVVTQVTATVTPAFNLPASALTLVTWVGVIGFPFVVAFSWVYELTPEGLRRERDVDSAGSITHVTGRRLDYLTIGIVAIGIVLFAFDRFSPRPENRGQTTVLESGETVAGPTIAKPWSVPNSPMSEKSIAVLPFVDMSAGKDQEYMSDGIAEELLNLLAQIPELHVAARTSAFSFKGKDLEIPEIARRLNVANILEGSVRKAGNKVRITAQLIHAADGYHLWSQTYDRTLDDIFAVQDEIATAVVEQMKIKLLGATPKVKEVDPKAYALYLEGRQLGRLFTPAAWEQSNSRYQQAVQIDANYAAAWDGLAANYLYQGAFGQRPIDEAYKLSREAVNKALALDPDYAEAHVHLGSIATIYDGDLAAAAQHYEKALALEPANTAIISAAATLAQMLGRLDTAIALGEYVVAHDPVNPAGHANLGASYVYAGRLDDAIASMRTALSLSPGRIGTEANIGIALLRKGESEAALAEVQKEAEEGDRLVALTMVYHALGKHAESDAALAAAIAKYEKIAAWNIAFALAYRGEADRAFEWLDKAVAYRDTGLPWVVVMPLFANIHNDPRWLPFLRGLGKAPEQLAAIKFDVKVPQ